MQYAIADVAKRDHFQPHCKVTQSHIKCDLCSQSCPRCLQQLPIDEIKSLRKTAVVDKTAIAIAPNTATALNVPSGVTKQSEALTILLEIVLVDSDRFCSSSRRLNSQRLLLPSK